MIPKLLNAFKRNIWITLLVGVSSYVFYQNYSVGVWLSGWDNLHPEMNFISNFKQTFFASWQQFQGLGFASAMAQASDLFRIMILWLLSIFVPTDALRYAWQLLMLILGSIGMFYLAKNVFHKKLNETLQLDVVAFLSALFYLLNLATLQTFFAPQSMFTTQFGFLPWLFMFVLLYLESGNKRNLLWYFVFSFLSATQAFTPTLIFAYFLFLGIALVVQLIVEKFSKQGIKRFLAVSLVTFAAHAFWLLPFTYFLSTGPDFVSEASINVFSSDESFLLNKKYSSVEDLAFLRGFWFGNTDYNVSSDGFTHMFAPWISHQETVLVTVIGWILFGFVLLGLLCAIVKKNRPLLLILFFGISLFFLRNTNPPLGFLFEIFRDNVPLFSEALRFPFTKFSLLTGFVYAILFGFGVRFFVELVKNKYLSLPILAVFTAGIVFWMYPAFEGNLISRNMRVSPPAEYFEFFDWMNSQPEGGRVLNTPMYVYWGWPYYDWGYRGSGFLWYGIDKPVLDRAFDVWSEKNEAVYWEYSDAIYAGDAGRLELLADKYNISWILIDKHIIVPGNPEVEKLLKREELTEMLGQSDMFQEAFNSGGLTVFEYLGNRSFVEVGNTPIAISDTSVWNRRDIPLELFGNYFISDTENGLIFPYSGLGTRKSSLVVEMSVDEMILKSNAVFPSGSQLEVPQFNEIGDLIPVNLKLEGSDLIIELLPIELLYGENSRSLVPVGERVLVSGVSSQTAYVSIQGNLFTAASLGAGGTGLYIDPQQDLEVYTYTGFPSEVIDVERGLVTGDLFACAAENAGSYELKKSAEGLTLTSRNNVGCVAQGFTLKSDLEDLVRITFDYSSEDSYAKYCLFDPSTSKCANAIEAFRGEKGPLIEDLLTGVPGGDFTWHFYVEPDKDESGSITYRDAKIEVYSPQKREVYLPEEFSQLWDVEETTSIDLFDTSAEISLIYPVVSEDENRVYEETFDQEDLFSWRNVCVGEVEEKPVVENGSLTLSAEKDKSCAFFEFPKLDAKRPYLVYFENTREAGKDQEACFISRSSSRCDTPYKIDSSPTQYFVQTPKDSEGGYSFLINNDSLGVELSRNRIDNLVVAPIPANLLGSMFGVPESIGEKVVLEDVSSKSHIFMHSVDTSGLSDASYIQLNQGYDPGWVALCGAEICPAKHVLANNWANGWVFENADIPASVKLVFWPQLLQFIGYFTLLGGLFFLIIPTKKQGEETTL